MSAEPTPKPQRPATLVFTQAVLALQAFVALFATLVAWSFAQNGIIDVPPVWVIAAGVVLIALFMFAAGRQDKRWGRWLGWGLQAPMLAAGLVVPAIAAIGVVFLAVWITGLRLGGRIDRERKEREAAAQTATEAGPEGDTAT